MFLVGNHYCIYFFFTGLIFWTCMDHVYVVSTFVYRSVLDFKLYIYFVS